jgi:uncharacterized protein
MKTTHKYILKEKNMSSWKDYKETFNLSEDIFALARSGNVQRLQEFLEILPGLDINQKNHRGYSPLMIAVYNSNQEVSELLLERGADPNSSDLSGNTILMGAAFKGNVEMVGLLLKQGANKNAENQTGFTAEQWASAFGRMDVVSILKPDANYSRSQNMMNAIKIIWGFIKPNTRKAVAA